MKTRISYKLIVTIIGILVFLSACSDDWLVTTDPNVQTTATFWQDAQDAKYAINAVYSVLQLDGTYMRFSQVTPNLRSGDSEASSPWVEMTWAATFTLPATSLQVRIIWRGYYQGIFRANLVLEHVPDIKMDSALKERILGQAHFLRGLYYFHLLTFYHNIPLILDTATGQTNYLVSQASPDSVWAQIKKDFSVAARMLPKSYSGTNVGRATWGAAVSYLGKAHLFTEQWQKAADALKKVIDSEEYHLVSNYAWNFDLEHENNAESIFEVQFTTEGGSVIGWQAPPGPNWRQIQAGSITQAPTGFGWSDVQPTQTLLNEFMEVKTADGKIDPRAKASLFFDYPGSTIYGQPWDAVYGDNSNLVFWKKYMKNNPGGSEIDLLNGINIRLMRYAGVLLMYAEAMNNLGQTAVAYTYVQKVRDRVNLPKLRNVKPNMTQQEMQEQIARARFLELAGEQHRFDDIVRWGWLYNAEKLNWLQQRDSEFSSWVPGREYLPIPQAELDVNPKLEQNPGY